MRKTIFMLTVLLLLSGLSLLQAQKLTRWDKKDWKRNMIVLEAFGGSGIVGLHYERVFPLGTLFSLRAHAGVTPFYMTEKYDFLTGKSITGMVGGGFYIFPKSLKLGIGCTMLNDIFFDRIPETQGHDTTGHPGPSDEYAPKQYKIRVMPYLAVEAYFSRTFFMRAAYTPIFDPANDAQKDLLVTHIGSLSFGVKF